MNKFILQQRVGSSFLFYIIFSIFFFCLFSKATRKSKMSETSELLHAYFLTTELIDSILEVVSIPVVNILGTKQQAHFSFNEHILSKNL